MIRLLPQATIHRPKGQRPTLLADRIASDQPPPPRGMASLGRGQCQAWLDTCIQERMVARLYRLFQGVADVRVYTDGEGHRLQVGGRSAPVWILDGEVAFGRWLGCSVYLHKVALPKRSGGRGYRRERARETILRYVHLSSEGRL